MVQKAVYYLWSLFVVSGTASLGHAWMIQRNSFCSSRTGHLPMISNIFRQDKGPILPSLPADVKEAVTRCRESTQEALKQRISRMVIDFPVGTKFGIESEMATKSKSSTPPTKTDIERSDRELARLFVEMFQPVGGENICVVFSDENKAGVAKRVWSDDRTAKANIVSIQRTKKSTRDINSKGFAAKLAAQVDDNFDTSGPFVLPRGTEVALFVAPGLKELGVIERICSKCGMDTLVILLNARLSPSHKFSSESAMSLFTERFEAVFHLAAAEQEVCPTCILFRAYPSDWVLARKPSVGLPKSILAKTVRPSREECAAAYLDVDISEVEKAVEVVSAKVSDWFL